VKEDDKIDFSLSKMPIGSIEKSGNSPRKPFVSSMTAAVTKRKDIASIKHNMNSTKNAKNTKKNVANSRKTAEKVA
jgi:hypothetical protein